MSKTASRTCPSCGARLGEGADVCDLCGTPVGAMPPAPDEPDDPTPAQETAAPPPEASEPPASASTPVAPDAPSPDGVFCNQCGWHNPLEARFCSMCGSRLQDLSEAGVEAVPVTPPEATTTPKAPTTPPAGTRPVAPPSPAEEPSPEQEAAERAEAQAMTRQVGIIVGAGVLLVLVLFLVTAVSKNTPEPTPTPSTPSATSNPAPATAAPLDEESLPPLEGQLADEVGALEAEIESLSGEARIERQRELVGLLFNAGRLDRAALEQQAIAEALDTPEAWKRAGDLFYDWMRAREEQGQRDPAIAQRAIDAYQKVLAVNPDDLDVRTDMATAYLSSNNPMQGVTEIRRVLDTDPNHVHARFNYGIMLSMIGRMDQAIEQFEQVKTLVDEGSQYYQQAEEAIHAIQQGGSL